MSEQAEEFVVRWAIEVDAEGGVWLRDSHGEREKLACYDLRLGLTKGNRLRAQWPSLGEEPRKGRR